MYRDDDLANAIYERAWAWTRASFFSCPIEPGPNGCEIHFTNGVVMSGLEAALYGANKGRDLNLLFCDLEPQDAWPHHAEALLYYPGGYSIPRDHLVGWTYVSGGVDEEKSKLKLNDRTEGIQRQLNRLRMRERIMMIGVARQSWRVAPLFAPDMSEIAKVSGVPESTVRGLFDGKQTNPEARDKILMAFNVLPEELEAKLWRGGS